MVFSIGTEWLQHQSFTVHDFRNVGIFAPELSSADF
jgi:hypothetical protein